MSLTEAAIINALVLFAVLEADLGPHRKVSLFRILRPLLLAGAIVPIFATNPTTHGDGLTLEIAGITAGILGGLLATTLSHVYRSPQTGQAVSRAGLGYASLWIVVIGLRMAFSYGSQHWFRSQLGNWMFTHHVTSDALTDALLLMAVAMTLTRTLLLAGRAIRVGQIAPQAVCS
ncbi:hypothetical protein ACFVFJ_46505 [Streptomyces sp. NPDC057717]|uniref:hypothetical protein n=1 Tax=Streptomyces sp. NPDC057717 TaxID=3346224 RepID=UPI0036929A64